MGFEDSPVDREWAPTQEEWEALYPEKENDMSGFLLMLVHTMDDFPIGLYASKDECVAAADARKISDDLTDAEQSVIGTDASTPLGFIMVEFQRGVPIAKTMLKWEEDA